MMCSKETFDRVLIESIDFQDASHGLSMRTRSKNGQSLAEIGPTLWFALIIIFFPMITYSTIGVRYILLMNAAKLAAGQAAQCRSFQTDISASEKSAVNTANSLATKAVGYFKGIHLQQITTSIVTCSYSGSTVTKRTTPLTSPPDVSFTCYDVEVLLQAQIDPIITNSSLCSLGIPGLTKPMTVIAKSDVVFENPQGLTQ